MSAIFLRRNLVMNFVCLVILALSGLRSGDANGCTSPYDKGPYKVKIVPLKEEPVAESKRFLSIAVPVEGKFPVVQFQHGFGLRTTCYSRLISHVASYGFIVVAPQMDFTSSYNATPEISVAIHVLKWIQANLESILSSEVPETKPDLSKLALVGHSRGGKVVFGMGIQLNGTIPISTIIGLDPVDGDPQGIQTDPPVLTFKENTLNMTVPTLIVGTRRGSENWPLFPPCAPENVSHNEFYKDLIGPVYHFVVAKEYGHMDFLDDAVCEGTRLACMGTFGSRARMSQFAGIEPDNRYPLSTYINASRNAVPGVQKFSISRVRNVLTDELELNQVMVCFSSSVSRFVDCGVNPTYPSPSCPQDQILLTKPPRPSKRYLDRAQQ